MQAVVVSPADTRLAPGDLVLLDFGAAVDGYCADTTRMAVAGEPTREQEEVHRVVLDAHDAAIASGSTDGMGETLEQLDELVVAMGGSVGRS